MGFNLLYWEGAFGTALDTWVGPLYLSGLAGELKVQLPLLAFITSLPWIGSVGQLLGLFAYQRFRSSKDYTIRVARVGRSLWFIPTFLAAAWAIRQAHGGAPFPRDTWFIILALTSFFASLLGGSTGMTWMSWIRELIPAEQRGRFFANKQRFGMLAAVAANAIAATWIGWKPHGYYLGYGIIAVLAIACGIASTFLLSRVAEPSVPKPDKSEIAIQGSDQTLEPTASQCISGTSSTSSTSSTSKYTPRRTQSFLESIQEPLHDPEFMRFATIAAAFNGSIQLASPYFPYYFTRELGIPMSSVALWTTLSSVGAFATAPTWGRRIDRAATPEAVLKYCAPVIALSPLFYSFGSPSQIQLWAPFDYLLSGVTGSGLQLITTALLLKNTPKGRGPAYFALYAAMNGFAGATGTYLGGRFSAAAMPLGGFRALFLFSTTARCGVVIWAGRSFDLVRRRNAASLKA